MSNPMLGEIRMFAGNFAPRSWAFCDGQLLSIAQHSALFSLLGTVYGGDGRTTFALPDLRGRVPVAAGTGPGLSARQLGDRGGVEGVSLTADHLGGHNHGWRAQSARATNVYPVGALLASSKSPAYSDQPANTPLRDTEDASGGVSTTGGSSSHNNLQPFVCIHFIIALSGVFPSRL